MQTGEVATQPTYELAAGTKHSCGLVLRPIRRSHVTTSVLQAENDKVQASRHRKEIDQKEKKTGERNVRLRVRWTQTENEQAT